MVPELPTATNIPEPIVKGDIVSILLVFLSESMTIIVQIEYVPSYKVVLRTNPPTDIL